jgi:hypothetical protein
VTTQQTSQQIEKQFLDSMYLISHSNKTKITYQTALNHFRKFAQIEYNTDETNIVLKIKSEELDVYQVIRNFVIYLDQKNIKVLSAKNSQLEKKFNDLLQYLRTNSIEIPTF